MKAAKSTSMPRSGVKSQVVTASGSVLVSFVGSSAVGTLLVTPGAASLGAYSSKLATLSSTFQLFRFTRLAIELNPANFIISGFGAQGLGIVGYTGDQVQGTAPSTPAGVVDCPWRTPYCGNGNTTGTGQTTIIRKQIPKSLLHAQNVQWFNTEAHSASSEYDLLYQGMIFVWGSTLASAGSATLIVDYTVSFKNFIDPVSVPSKMLAPACGQDAVKKQDQEDSDSIEEL